MKRLGILLVMGLAVSACMGGNVFTLEEGDCFNDETEFSEEVSDVPIVECGEPHDNEVYRVVEMTDSSYPGFDATGSRADSLCLEAFETFVGTPYVDSALEISWLIPTEESWGAGDREIVCFLYRLDFPKMTGTMEGSGI